MTQNVRVERPWGNGRLAYTFDATANDSDKTFTVPANCLWKIVSISVFLQTTATVGNRSMAIAISNATPAVITISRVSTTHAASLNYWYNFVFGNVTATNVTGSGWSQGVPDAYLPAGYSIRVYDAAAIDAAADDMTVSIQYIEYQV